MIADVLWIVIAVIFLLWFWEGRGRDDTDTPNGERSGLRLYTDHKTGVQYVGTLFGALHVRLDAEGKPVTVKKAEQ